MPINPPDAHFTEIRNIPYSAFPDPSTVPPWMLFLDSTGLGLWRAYAGFWFPLSSRTLLKTSFGPVASFDFTNIPTVFRYLEIISTLKSDRLTAGQWVDNIYLSLNGDTNNANYDGMYEIVTGPNSFISAEVYGAQLARWVGYASTAQSPPGQFALLEIMIANPASSTMCKTVRVTNRAWVKRSAGGVSNVNSLVGWDNAVAPVTRVTLTPGAGTQFIVGSTSSLYGVL